MKIKHIFLTLVTLVGIAVLSSCGNKFIRDTGETIDKTKTQLYIGNFDGGLGHDWLETVAALYEEKNPTIQIIINNEKDMYSDSNLYINMPNYINDIYFLNGITYSNYVAKGLIADITDVVKGTIEGENESIYDKMNPTLRDYYETDDGKFYAVPFFDSIFGAVYDVDLFEEEGFYFNSDGNLICYDPNNTELSAGPNGISGDYDDGLPATFSQWKELVDTIKSFGYTPYSWNGTYDYYRLRYLTAIWADYEGKANFDLNFSFNGEYTLPSDEEPTTINIKNAYLLQKQPGKKYALDFAEYIIKNGLYDRNSFDTVNTHLMAQETYLFSAVNPNTNRIAMLLEGGWWENEARSFFNTMAKTYGQEYGFGQRRFGFMPTPKADDGSSAEGTTLISSTGNSVVVINAKTNVLDIAKDFLEFAHSDEALRIFTRMTGSVRPYDYEMTEEDFAQMTYYAKNMFEIYHNPTTQISYVSLYYHKAFVEQASFLGSKWWWNATISGKSLAEPFYEFSQNKNLTAEAYFQGLQTTYSKNAWDQKMSEYYKEVE